MHRSEVGLRITAAKEITAAAPEAAGVAQLVASAFSTPEVPITRRIDRRWWSVLLGECEVRGRAVLFETLHKF